jgi:hypothetical protein
MNFSASRLQRTLNDPPVPFNFGDYISRGFKIMNDNFGPFLGFMLLSTVISFFCQVIPVIGMFLSILITPVFQIGYAQYSYMVTTRRQADFGEFFKGFNKLGPLVGTYLLSGLIGLLAVLPGIFIWFQAGMWEWVSVLIEEYPFIQNLPDLFETVDVTLFSLGMVLIMIGALVVGSLFSWALNIAWFFEVGPMEALTASRKLIARNWLTFIGFLIVTGIVAACGALLCGIGVLYTAPAMACAQFFAFADATRLFESDNDQQDIIDHFIA